MRVLVVGCGYIGFPLAEKLVRCGHEVSGLRRSGAEQFQAAGIKPLIADITQFASLKNLPSDFDWVVNCAASGGGGADDYRKIYLEGNRNLISWFADSPVQKFVYTSSTSVYAQNDGSIVTENSPAEPDSETAKILVEAENILIAAAKNNFPSVILRVAGIYGPERGYAFKQFLRGEAKIENDGSRFLNMIHRDDVIGAIIAALENGKAGEIYNAADCEPVSQLKFFDWLAAELKKPLPPKVHTDENFARKRGVTNKQVSNQKLVSELNYKFQFPNFRTGYTAEIARQNLLAR
jgi:nucleoside-diphosphate-sugar epimerase